MDTSQFKISLAEDSATLRRCFPVMVELRPHLTEGTFLERTLRQRETAGYQLAFLEQAGLVRSLAGFRITEFLAWGRTLYIDDLVTRADSQGQNLGSRLFDWVLARARAEKCDQVHLDSGVQRLGAHRFYLHKGMDITAHHFAYKIV
jgi:GNAT superfamily N-acetyltransferase